MVAGLAHLRCLASLDDTLNLRAHGGRHRVFRPPKGSSVFPNRRVSFAYGNRSDAIDELQQTVGSRITPSSLGARYQTGEPHRFHAEPECGPIFPPLFGNRLVVEKRPETPMDLQG